MPFVEPRSRDRIKAIGEEACESVGDLCYVFYSHIMTAWRNEPRWRTAHRMFKDFSEQPEACDYFEYVYGKVKNNFELADVVCAAKLAWHVFYDMHVYDYEVQQMEKNGNI